MNKEKHSKVLIVDDAQVNRLILASILESNGISSDLAEGGRECIDMCKKNTYDLILLDHRMPDIDGIDTFVELKEIFETQGRDIPVICHTTDDAEKNINLYKAAGFADVLLKPINPQQLSDILLTYLPEGAVVDNTKKSEEEQRILKEISNLPDWVSAINGLDTHSGIEHCKTSEDFIDTLSVFVHSISAKSEDIRQFARESNWKMYTLRVHSLKSMSQLIGANSLADIAEELEYAGRHEDTAVIAARTPELLKEYLAFSTLLEHLPDANDDNKTATTTLPDISEATLSDAYTAISDFADCYDTESIQMVLNSLNSYHLPDSEQTKTASINKALHDSDWEALRKLL